MMQQTQTVGSADTTYLDVIRVRLEYIQADGSGPGLHLRVDTNDGSVYRINLLAHPRTLNQVRRLALDLNAGATSIILQGAPA